MNAIKKIFKLIRLGVFCKWFTNVKEYKNCDFMEATYLLRSQCSFMFLICGSFPWDDTPEGYSFWQNISEK